MKRRTEDHYGARVKDQGASDTPLWSVAQSSQSPVERKRDVERLKERLLPIVCDMAKRRGPEGVTASEVLAEGLVLGILTPAPSHDPRRYAFIGPWLAALAHLGILAPKTVKLPDGSLLHVKRKSLRHSSHANPNAIYISPELAA
jgi:hypothetical protein